MTSAPLQRWRLRLLQRLLNIPVPSWGPGRPARRGRWLVLLAVRDEVRFLPGFLRNVTPHVEGIIALDDGSTDGSDRLLADHPAVLELLRNPPDRPAWDEPGNHRRLIDAALRHRPDWLLCLDADERLERHFRLRAERVVARGSIFGFSAYSLHFRELWDDPLHYRSDGLWAGRVRARLFRPRHDHGHDPSPLHGQKAPLQSKVLDRFPRADLILYHLRMVRSQDREARRERYQRLDPDCRWQSIGYAYLTDPTGLRLRPLPPGRDFVD